MSSLNWCYTELGRLRIIDTIQLGKLIRVISLCFDVPCGTEVG